ncbi:Eco57I restriction-modification methylase domain-containing protein [Leptodesmis sichuanensis]|uniref:Eco57I restriction-modification methylase domain-containing protein n=1 Tax=Leptodesmis sichuanensis TaxID=2906798 RepID=UPI001F187D67|nr:DUF559 domain-containing protein [Leptodesmis sichuanensis]UIE36935.1 DUF559 domain-containing protein [Leptodesmis sichuanensis A121]
MSDLKLKQDIARSLNHFSTGNLADHAQSLFQTLGYQTDKAIRLDSPTVDAFRSQFDQGKVFNPKTARSEEWQFVDLMFQLTKDEITGSEQIRLNFGGSPRIDNSIIESYLFFAIELAGNTYSRSQLASITREINKLFPMPVMLVFKHGQTLTLSIINRRLHKRDESKDVLEKVTLIKDIDCANPHRAHVEILFDLSLEQLYKTHKFSNFVELHRAWQKTLDSTELNKRFFQEISDWYFWARQQVRFPDDAPKDEEGLDSVSLIRLITRLIFVWFLKEKRPALIPNPSPQGEGSRNQSPSPQGEGFRVRANSLVPDELFQLPHLKELIDLDDPTASTYYKAILQNLFFATLNQEMNTPEQPDNRKFRGKAKPGSRDQHFMVHNVYRYRDLFRQPEQALQLFEQVPFLNGGLFECLDQPDPQNPKQTLRIDGFSDRADNPLSVPNYLFFSDEQEIDLNEVYGTKKKRFKVRGLINIFSRYKFTITENTPLEEEIALDPELLGKVFENLLAAYNPETKVTARKQTGSFYTPREVVDYMVDESLLVYLENALLPSPPAPLPGERGAGTSPTLTLPSPWGVGRRTCEAGGRGDEGDPISGKLREIPRALLERARELRSKQTPAEEILWECLRDRRLHNFKFRRQHNIGQYITDFYCHGAKLVIELDGGIHETQTERDADRDSWMQSQGLTVLRLRNEQIFEQLETALQIILSALIPSPSPQEEGSWNQSPSPQGEGFRVREKLRQLLDYKTPDNPFADDPENTVLLIAAIDSLKVLDPAVGSGAFPMGMLQKLVFILGKLDPNNEFWKHQQKEREIRPVLEDLQQAQKISYEQAREAAVKQLEERLAEIEADFADNEMDYPRKLFLIENSIYGVDIQPIAVQIAKLRFFISLIVEQRVDDTAPNRGILPLPNLETKFIAANTLMSIDRPAQMTLGALAVQEKEQELAEVRHRIFTARTQATKNKYREKDKQLRDEIAVLLKREGWADHTATQLAQWNPYDQNASAGFFDPEWMFGIKDRFDVCIGNPPYVRQEQIKHLKEQFKSQYECFTGTADLYVYFYERGLKLLREQGVLTFISSNKYFRAAYGQKLRQFLTSQTRIHQIIDFGDAPVFTAIAYPTIVVIEKGRPSPLAPLPRERGTGTPPSPQGEGGRGDEGLFRALNWEMGQPLEQFETVVQTQSFGMPQAELKAEGWQFADRTSLRLLEKLRQAGTPLGKYVNGRFYYGIKTGLNEAFVVDRATRDRLIAEHSSSAEVLKPFLRGRDVKRWVIDYADLYLNAMCN